MTDVQVERRASDGGFYLAQTPYNEDYSERLAGATGITQSDLYNMAMQLLCVTLSVYTAGTGGTEYVIRDAEAGLYRRDPALMLLLGDILAALRQREEAVKP